MSKTTQQKFETFKALHATDKPLLIPNPWDAGTAMMLAGVGYQALATTSAGVGFRLGLPAKNHPLTLQLILDNAREIVEATDLPVNADLENGFGDTPQAAADAIGAAVDTGLVGGSIEDYSGNREQPIYDFSLAVERIQAAHEAAAGKPFILTARTENFLYGRKDLDDTIKRLQAFSKAGADVLYAPGLPSLDAIAQVCEAVDKPVNVVMGLTGGDWTVDQLATAGVKRISVGGAFARAALSGLMRAAREVIEQGTFTFSRDSLTGAQIAAYRAGEKPKS